MPSDRPYHTPAWPCPRTTVPCVSCWTSLFSLGRTAVVLTDRLVPAAHLFRQVLSLSHKPRRDQRVPQSHNLQRQQSSVLRTVDSDCRHWHAARHLHGSKQSVQASQTRCTDWNADDRKDRGCGQSAGQMGGLARCRYDDLHATGTSAPGKLQSRLGRAVRRNDARFPGNGKGTEHGKRRLQNGQICVTAHDDDNLWHDSLLAGMRSGNGKTPVAWIRGSRGGLVWLV